MAWAISTRKCVQQKKTAQCRRKAKNEMMMRRMKRHIRGKRSRHDPLSLCSQHYCSIPLPPRQKQQPRSERHQQTHSLPTPRPGPTSEIAFRTVSATTGGAALWPQRPASQFPRQTHVPCPDLATVCLSLPVCQLGISCARLCRQAARLKHSDTHHALNIVSPQGRENRRWPDGRPPQRQDARPLGKTTHPTTRVVLHWPLSLSDRPQDDAHVWRMGGRGFGLSYRLCYQDVHGVSHPSHPASRSHPRAFTTPETGGKALN